ncbi:MAG: hypothetical protein ABSB69_14380 [Solirubrobacteraceae bacterium]
MSSFEDRLWSELARNHGEPLASAVGRARLTRRRPARRILVAGGAALAVAAAAAATLALTAGTTTPAYAVVVNRDGSVTLTLNELLGTRAADARLASLGVRVRVVTREQGCTAKGELAPLGTGFVRQHSERQHVESILLAEGALLQGAARPQKHTGFGGLTILIHPNVIPPGDTVVITARLLDRHNGDGSSHAMGIGSGLYRDPAPTCLPLG